VSSPHLTEQGGIVIVADTRRVAYLDHIDAGKSCREAARAAGIDPERNPVGLANYTPEILDGIPLKLIKRWEGERRVPRGTFRMAHAYRAGHAPSRTSTRRDEPVPKGGAVT
jgi:hypothetical protein